MVCRWFSERKGARRLKLEGWRYSPQVHLMDSDGRGGSMKMTAAGFPAYTFVVNAVNKAKCVVLDILFQVASSSESQRGLWRHREY